MVYSHGLERNFKCPCFGDSRLRLLVDRARVFVRVRVRVCVCVGGVVLCMSF